MEENISHTAVMFTMPVLSEAQLEKVKRAVAAVVPFPFEGEVRVQVKDFDADWGGVVIYQP